jgi:hypothetical protein
MSDVFLADLSEPARRAILAYEAACELRAKAQQAFDDAALRVSERRHEMIQAMLNDPVQRRVRSA